MNALQARFHSLVLGMLIAVGTLVRAAGTDVDALALESDAADQAAPSTVSTHKAFFEGGLGWADQRYGLGSRTIGRAALDGRYEAPLAESIRGAVSARLDWTDPPDERIGGAVFSLREAYVGWQDRAATNVVEVGRVALRDSPGYGYNPTDFFRDNSLRTFAAVDPGTLRDYRMGSVMIRGQHLWSGGSVALVYSPKLADDPSDDSFSLDLGATNARGRGQVSAGWRVSDSLNTEVLLLKEAGADTRFGASLSALVADSAVVRAEATYGKEPTVLARALGMADQPQTGHRLNIGGTYTTASRLSLTAEYHYNGFALDRDGWEALQASGPSAQVAYYTEALALQDNAARDALFFYAFQRDLGMRNLDLTALLKLNLTDRSRLAWLDLTYRWPRLDLSLRALRNLGDPGTEYGIVPTKYSVGVVAVAYF